MIKYLLPIKFYCIALSIYLVSFKLLSPIRNFQALLEPVKTSINNQTEWRLTMFYLQFSAGLLVILTLMHAALSALDYHATCQCHQTAHSMGESLLNATPECYNHFEEVLVSMHVNCQITYLSYAFLVSYIKIQTLRYN